MLKLNMQGEGTRLKRPGWAVQNPLASVSIFLRKLEGECLTQGDFCAHRAFLRDLEPCFSRVPHCRELPWLQESLQFLEGGRNGDGDVVLALIPTFPHCE